MRKNIAIAENGGGASVMRICQATCPWNEICGRFDGRGKSCGGGGGGFKNKKKFYKILLLKSDSVFTVYRFSMFLNCFSFWENGFTFSKNAEQCERDEKNLRNNKP